MALHRARALLGEKEIRLRHIERALRLLAPRRASSQPAAVCADLYTFFFMFLLQHFCYYRDFLLLIFVQSIAIFCLSLESREFGFSHCCSTLLFIFAFAIFRFRFVSSYFVELSHG